MKLADLDQRPQPQRGDTSLRPASGRPHRRETSAAAAPRPTATPAATDPTGRTPGAAPDPRTTTANTTHHPRATVAASTAEPRSPHQATVTTAVKGEAAAIFFEKPSARPSPLGRFSKKMAAGLPLDRGGTIDLVGAERRTPQSGTVQRREDRHQPEAVISPRGRRASSGPTPVRDRHFCRRRELSHSNGRLARVACGPRPGRSAKSFVVRQRHGGFRTRPGRGPPASRAKRQSGMTSFSSGQAHHDLRAICRGKPQPDHLEGLAVAKTHKKGVRRGPRPGRRPGGMRLDRSNRIKCYTVNGPRLLRTRA